MVEYFMEIPKVRAKQPWPVYVWDLCGDMSASRLFKWDFFLDLIKGYASVEMMRHNHTGFGIEIKAVKVWVETNECKNVKSILNMAEMISWTTHDRWTYCKSKPCLKTKASNIPLLHLIWWSSQDATVHSGPRLRHDQIRALIHNLLPPLSFLSLPPESACRTLQAAPSHHQQEVGVMSRVNPHGVARYCKIMDDKASYKNYQSAEC